MNVILIGYRATGKSTVGQLLSKKLLIPFVDTDSLIEEAAGMKIKDIVADAGWQAFRKKEKEAVHALCEKDPCVVATGGGAILDAANRAVFKKTGVVVFLKASPEDIVDRLRRDVEDGQTRPKFTSEDLVSETMAVLGERMPLYESAADITVDTKDKSVVRVTDEVYQHLLEAGIVSEIKKIKKRFKKRL
ncbi:MAG: shikimate kinase [Smithellaceae bacterium]